MKKTMGKITAITVFFLVLLVAFAVSQQTDISQSPFDKISPYVLELLETQDTIKVNIYVEDPATHENLNTKDFDRIVKETGKKKVSRTHPEVIIATLNKKEILSLAEKAEVRHIVQNILLYPHLQDAVGIIGANETWNIQIPTGGMNLTGEGRTICVIDTGIDFTHPDLAAKNMLPKTSNVDCTIDKMDCFINPDGTDSAGPVFTGHGTHVAGIAAAAGGINGIAKGADLIGVRVCDESGFCPNDQIKMAIDWCVANAEAYNINVITMSLGTLVPFTQGFHCDDTDWDDLEISVEINAANAANIPITISTGNGGYNDGDNPPNSPPGVTFPACLSGAISVAATKKEDDAAWRFSNYHPFHVRLFAPGVLITSTCSPNDADDCEGNYTIKSGTSMSAPMVAGSIAIFKQFEELTNQGPMNHTEIESWFHETGDPVTEAGPNDYRRINIYQAVTYCQSNASCDDGNACNGAESCNLKTRECETGTPLTCNDNNICNGEETCDPSEGCQAGIPLICDDDLFCNGEETCDPSEGCQTGTPPTCNDEVGCTVDSCNTDTDSCNNLPDNSACDNGLFCDGTETCDVDNDCQPGEPVQCDEGEICDVEVDECVPIPPTCPADFDNDGTIGASDLAQLLGAWGDNPGHQADFDGDGDVDAADLAFLLGNWGPCS